MLQTNSTLTYNILQAHMLVIRLQSLYNTVLTFFLGEVECLLDVILIHVVDKQGARDKLGNAPHHKAHPYHDPQAGTRQVFKTHLWNITKKEHCIYETHCKSRDRSDNLKNILYFIKWLLIHTGNCSILFMVYVNNQNSKNDLI